jgi:hypothetical protein
LLKSHGQEQTLGTSKGLDLGLVRLIFHIDRFILFFTGIVGDIGNVNFENFETLATITARLVAGHSFNVIINLARIGRFGTLAAGKIFIAAALFGTLCIRTAGTSRTNDTRTFR